MLGAIGNIKI